MNPAWNLGNTLDAIPHEGGWNNPPVEDHVFDYVVERGFKGVRIPGMLSIWRLTTSWPRSADRMAS